MKQYGSWSELVSIIFRQNSQAITVRPNQATTYTASRDIQLPPGDAAHVLTSTDSTQTLTNKSIDADTNTITNIENADIKSGAAIDAAKIANGSVSNTEFQYLDGVTSAIQTQITAKVSGPASSTDNAVVRFDGTTGKLVQNSVAVLDDVGVGTGFSFDGDDNTFSDLALTVIKTVLADANKIIRRDASGVIQSGNSVPNTSALLTTDSASVVTLKDFDGGTASNTSRVTLPKNTTTNLNALTRKVGTVLYDTDTGQVKFDNGTVLAALSSASVATATSQGTVTSYVPVIQSGIKTVSSANYTILDNDGFDTIAVTTGASDRTITLPSAANNVGRTTRIKKVDNGAGRVLVTRAGSDTIDGFTTVPLALIGDSADFTCLSTSTFGITASHTNTNTYTTTLTPNSAGTITATFYTITRHGTYAVIKGQYKTGTLAGTTASITLPTGITIKSTALDTTANHQQLGILRRLNSGSTVYGANIILTLFYDGSTTNTVFICNTMTTNAYQKEAASAVYAPNQDIDFEFTIPVSEWTST